MITAVADKQINKCQITAGASNMADTKLLVAENLPIEVGTAVAKKNVCYCRVKIIERLLNI